MKKWMLIAQLLLAVVVKAEGSNPNGHKGADLSQVNPQVFKEAPQFPKEVGNTLRPGTGPCAAPQASTGSSLPSSGGLYY